MLNIGTKRHVDVYLIGSNQPETYDVDDEQLADIEKALHDDTAVLKFPIGTSGRCNRHPVRVITNVVDHDSKDWTNASVDLWQGPGGILYLADPETYATDSGRGGRAFPLYTAVNDDEETMPSHFGVHGAEIRAGDIDLDDLVTKAGTPVGLPGMMHVASYRFGIGQYGQVALGPDEQQIGAEAAHYVGTEVLAELRKRAAAAAAQQ